MANTSKKTTLVALTAAVLLLVCWPHPAPAQSALSLEEDIEFGSGLVTQKFYDLAIEILNPILPKLTSDNQKRQAYTSLATAHSAMSSRSYPDLSAQEDKQIRDQHMKAASDYRGLLTKLGPGAKPNTLEGLVELATQARQLQAQIELEPSPEGKKQLTDSMITSFNTAMAGLAELYKKADDAIKKHVEKQPEDWESPAYKKWEAALPDLQEPLLCSGVELNRVRYWYTKTLNAAPDAAKKKELLEKIVEELGALVREFDVWAYTIVGNLTLADACVDLGKFTEAVQSCEAALELMKQFVEQDPKMKEGMVPWRNKCLAAWAYAQGKLDNFDEAVAKIRDVTAPEVQIVRGEVYLMKAQQLAAKGKKPESEQARKDGDEVLDTVAATNDYWTVEVDRVRKKYGVTVSGFVEAQTEFDKARKARNNPAIIAASAKLLAFGSVLPTEKRSQILAILGVAYWQERLYYEAYTVYTHMSASEKTDAAAENHAKFAVASLQNQFKQTQDPIDEVLFEEARKWLRDNYAGPGEEYTDAIKAKEAGEKEPASYEKAIQLFAAVPKGSLHYEAALEQIGECRLLQAKQFKKTDPAKCQEFLEKARTAFDDFLQKTKTPPSSPKVLECRKRLMAGAIYRIATIDMWENRENYKACLEGTEDYAEKFPEMTDLHPYVSVLRLRSFVALKDVAGATAEFDALQKYCGELKDAKRTQPLITYARQLVFTLYAKVIKELREQSAQHEALAIKTKDEQQAQELRKQALEEKSKATDTVARALAIVSSAIAADHAQPYEWYRWIIYEYDQQNNANQLRQYVGLFLKQFGDKKNLTPAQTKEVEEARVMLGIAHYKSGEYEQAYKILAERRDIMDRALKKTGGKPGREYWVIVLYIGRTAKELAGKKDRYAEEAMDIFLKLRNLIEKYSHDWWDVAVSILEIRNSLGRHDDNLLVIRRAIDTQRELGGSLIRTRYMRVLEEISKRGSTPEKRTEALDLLVRVYVVELKGYAQEKRYAEIIRTIRNFRSLISIDCGGKHNRDQFIPIVEDVHKNTPDEQIKTDAEVLIKALKEQ